MSATIADFDNFTSQTTSIYKNTEAKIELCLTRYTAAVAILSAYVEDVNKVSIVVYNNTTKSQERPLPYGADDDEIQYPLCHTDDYRIDLHVGAKGEHLKTLYLTAKRGWSIRDLDCVA